MLFTRALASSTCNYYSAMGAGQGRSLFSIWCLIVAWTIVSSSVRIRTVGAQDNAPMQRIESICQELQPSPSVEQFVDELPQPPVIDISTGAPLLIGAYKIKQKLHRDLPETTLYAYGISQETASSPGPTLVATRGIESKVRWENHIDDLEHFLAIDHTLHWAKPTKGVPMVVHLHGGEVLSESDGHPDAWYTSSGETGPSFTTMNYTYANTQAATLLWYHDHTVGITRLNMVAGLNGMYLIRDPDNEPKNLPSGEFEKLLVIQDKFIREDGSVNFPTVGVAPAVHPTWCPEYYGDIIFINGKAWPFLNVLPTKYRFRIVNAANARFFVMALSHPNVTFTQIGTDGGYLPSPVNRTSLTLGPAERLDFIIDFSLLQPGDSVIVKNSGNAPYPDGDPTYPTTTGLMKFNVVTPGPNQEMSHAEIPLVLGTEVNITTWTTCADRVNIRRMTLTEMDDGMDHPTGSLLNGLRWRDNVTETPKLNTTEIWEIINLTEDAHPIHIHLIQFRVKSQQAIDSERYLNNSCSLDQPFPDPSSCYTEEVRAPEEFHEGWKDTATVFPGKVTIFIMRWATQANEGFAFDPTSGPGYVWHCHILDHEDNDMMRPLHLKASA